MAALEQRAAALVAREGEVAARARTLAREARDQARAYLLEARRQVEDALGRARAAVDEATARQARRLLEQAIEDTSGGGAESGEPGGEAVRGEGWVSLEALRRRQPAAAGPGARRRSPATERSGEARLAAGAAAASEISLVGLRVAEAEPLLVKALDDAVVAELPALRVVHGKGTGALRQLVHDVLAADPRVRRFGFAPPAQGGHGVTVVELTA